jgi:hypothetical protein
MITATNVAVRRADPAAELRDPWHREVNLGDTVLGFAPDTAQSDAQNALCVEV